ncbi:MAG: hypothetical protein JWO05_2126 [Gemmatimonadetes bacterium]|nr:hypothetical protein [Gemmatimonadota bacterium]
MARQTAPVRYAARVDALGGRLPSVQGGGTVSIPAGIYARVDFTVAAGYRGAHGLESSGKATGRGDVMMRFLFDPIGEQRWGLSAGAGVSLKEMDVDRYRPVLLLGIETEGPMVLKRFRPAFTAGLGGGWRLGALLRTAPSSWR